MLNVVIHADSYFVFHIYKKRYLFTVFCFLYPQIYETHRDICPADSCSPLTVASQHVCHSESPLNAEIAEIHFLLLEGVQDGAKVSKDGAFLPGCTQKLVEVYT